MVAELYNENNLYTIASNLSNFIESKTPKDSITYRISKALRQLYNNELCNSSIEEMLLIQAWRLTLLMEFAQQTEDKQVIDMLVDTQIKPFVDSIEKLGIDNMLRKHLHVLTT